MHTNYLDYARREEGGETKAKLLEAYNNWVCRVHCHKVHHIWCWVLQASLALLPPGLAQCCGCKWSSARVSKSSALHDTTSLLPADCEAERRSAAAAAADDAVCAWRAQVLSGGWRGQGSAARGWQAALHPRCLLHGQGTNQTFNPLCAHHQQLLSAVCTRIGTRRPDSQEGLYCEEACTVDAPSACMPCEACSRSLSLQPAVSYSLSESACRHVRQLERWRQLSRHTVTVPQAVDFCIGQVVWAKGYTELVELMGKHAAREGSQPHIDCYGNGEDLADVAAKAKAARLDLDMKGGIDHLDPSMHEYKARIPPAAAGALRYAHVVQVCAGVLHPPSFTPMTCHKIVLSAGCRCSSTPVRAMWLQPQRQRHLLWCVLCVVRVTALQLKRC
jgi:hypothetical protein